jgi:hypothetical protein
MTDVAEQRAMLERQLAELRLVHPFPVAEAITEWHAKIAALEERLRKLPPTPRPGGPIVKVRA